MSACTLSMIFLLIFIKKLFLLLYKLNMILANLVPYCLSTFLFFYFLLFLYFYKVLYILLEFISCKTSQWPVAA